MRKHANYRATLRLSFVFFFFALSGCAKWEVLKEIKDSGWLVVNYQNRTWVLHVLDIAGGEEFTLQPFVEAIVGKKVGEDLPYCLPSPEGRFIACLHKGGHKFSLVNVIKETSEEIETPGKGWRIGSMAWSPDEKRLLCAVYETDEEEESSRGRLFLWRVDDGNWLELKNLGIVKGKRYSGDVTTGAWEDKHVFLYHTDGYIRRYDLQTGRIQTLIRGWCPYSLDHRRFICEPAIPPGSLGSKELERLGISDFGDFEVSSYYCVVEWKETQGKWVPGPGLVRESDIFPRTNLEVRGWPTVSPNRRYILCQSNDYMVQHFMVSAVARNTGVYDVERRRFVVLIPSGTKASFVADRVAEFGKVWIIPVPQLRKHLKRVNRGK